MVSFKEKAQSNRRLTRLFDTEDDRLGAKRRCFRFFKQALIPFKLFDQCLGCNPFLNCGYYVSLRQYRTMTARRLCVRCCLHIFRQLTQILLEIRQYSCVEFMQADEISDCAIHTQSLCGVALKRDRYKYFSPEGADKMIFAGICAAGTGSRLGEDMPKQFLMLRGKPVISYSAEALLKWKDIEKIFIAVSPDYYGYCKNLFKDDRIVVINGGKNRAQTVALLAEKALSSGNKDDILITHDAARPFVSTETIKACVRAAEKYGASGTALKATDTVLQCKNGFVSGAPDRTEMFLAQTPQCFRLGSFKEVWDSLSDNERERATDACGMFFRAGKRVKIVEGNEACFKITVKEDLEKAERFAEKLQAPPLNAEN